MIRIDLEKETYKKDINRAVCYRFDEYVVKLGLSNSKICADLHLQFPDETAVSRYRSGVRGISLYRLLAFCKKYNIDPKEFFDGIL